MVNVAWIIVGAVAVFVGIPSLIFVYWYFSSHKFRVRIARQTGENIDDVIWIEDKFKVIEKDGRYSIKFLWQRERTPSVPFKYWSKYTPGKWKMTHEEWKNLDMSKHIRRGLILYQTTEGAYMPMSINRQRDFTILPQDNRAFVIDQFMHANELSLTPKKAYIAAGILALAVIVMATLFILYLVYLNEVQITQAAKPVTNAFLDTAQGVVGA